MNGKFIKSSIASLLFVPLLVGVTQAQDETYKLDEVYKISPTGKIELQTDDANVRITGTDRKDVHVYIYRKVIVRGIKFGNKREFEVEVMERGGDLVIREKEWGGYSVMSMGYQREEYEVTIEAPASVSLEIKGDDDDYVVRNVDGSIVMNIDDGDIDISNCDGNHFEFDLDDGDLEMDGGGGFLYVRSDDGDVAISDAKFNEISANLDDGDILIETTLENNGDYTFRVDDGSIDLRVLGGGGEFEIRHDDARVISSDDFTLIEKDDNETILKLSNGNARVRMRADDSRVRLSRL